MTNFSRPIRFREEKQSEDISWEDIKRASRVPLKKMSRNISQRFNSNQRLGTTLCARRRQ